MTKKFAATLSVFILLVTSAWPVLAATRAEWVSLPGWLGWLLVIVAIGLMVGVNTFLRKGN